MTLNASTFDHLQPTQGQVDDMKGLRAAALVFARAIETYVPDGPDRTYILRTLRTLAMWANVAVTRTQDGAPRE